MMKFSVSWFVVLGASLGFAWEASACCAVSTGSSKVVNADQTVIILWDARTQTQHFVRQAAFASDANDVGFIVPTPTKPDLEEAGDAAFDLLRHVTAPVGYGKSVSFPTGCAGREVKSSRGAVEVLERKRVAGFDAVVLKAGSSDALTDWLADNGFSYSPEVATWSEPYIARGWPFTALKIAGDNTSRAPGAASEKKHIDAAALRISFKTDAPLFPYREPESKAASKKLGMTDRLLRIYFIGETAYNANFTDGEKWSGRKVWSGNITHSRDALLKHLGLPAGSVPKSWWLTEFEDDWPYATAPGDVTFSPSKDRRVIQRHADAASTDPTLIAFALVALGTSLVRRRLYFG
ncbi:MAG: DUF2330 domain-containing protein [Verrucomicrobiae bacterium]|nr:DUF2330 domain-containing protein [Verrucomicrobiae bacterium]